MEKTQALEIMKLMCKIRMFEDRLSAEFAKGNIPGFIHLYSGEEAVAVGVCQNLRKDDYIVSTHRGHGHVIAKGGDVKLMMAELFGRKTGYCKGKGGSMHIADLGIGNIGTTGIVGGGFPLSVGAALSAQYRKTDQVSVCFFGDGASNQGSFHESVNLASIWKLPVIFVCENNLYAESTHVSTVVNVDHISTRASAYGIPGKTVSGWDVVAVFNASKEAVERARRGDGPTLLECETYRYYGHFQGDVGSLHTYREEKEILEWQTIKDPINNFKKRLIEDGTLTEHEFEGLQNEVKQEIEEAVKYASESPWPEPKEAHDDLFASVH